MAPRPDRAIARALFDALLRRKATIGGDIAWAHVATGGRPRFMLDDLEVQPRLSLVSRGDLAAVEPIRDCLQRALAPHPKLEAIRAYRLSGEDGVVLRDPYGSGGEYEQPRSLTEDRVRLSSGWMHGQVLYELVRAFQPPICLELGTAYGVSGLYLLAGSEDGRLVTVEADPDRRGLALEAFTRFGVDGRVTSALGTFSEQLPQVLAQIEEPLRFVFEDGPHVPEVTLGVFESVIGRMASGGILVFDDLYHENGNEAAWRLIATHEEVLAAAEVNGRLGICVKR